MVGSVIQEVINGYNNCKAVPVEAIYIAVVYLLVAAILATSNWYSWRANKEESEKLCHIVSSIERMQRERRIEEIARRGSGDVLKREAQSV